ncbi:MAG: hypothetical protein ACE5LU_19115 [Anaerolineae bacterium]
MMSNNEVRGQLENRLREISARLAQTQNPDEEERLLNELLYLRGAVAGLDISDGRDERLLRILKGGSKSGT